MLQVVMAYLAWASVQFAVVYLVAAFAADMATATGALVVVSVVATAVNAVVTAGFVLVLGVFSELWTSFDNKRHPMYSIIGCLEHQK